MRNLVVLFIHLIATLARLLGPGGVRSLVAESLLLKHQLLLLNRSRQRSPSLRASDRFLAGWMAFLVRPTRLLRSAIVLRPSTLLALHKALGMGKSSVMRMLPSGLKGNRVAVTAGFNAWHHQKEDHLLAYRLEEIRKQVARSFRWHDCGICSAGFSLTTDGFAQ